MSAWGNGTSLVTIMASGGSFTSGPATVNTPRLQGESICTVEAVSCSDIRYNACCVPTLGKFTLSQQWIPSRPETKFTIHGLWPGACNTGSEPDNVCDPERDYNNVDLNRYIQTNILLHAKMLADMPSAESEHISHWKHQWRKHGTCVSDIKPGCHNIKKGQDVVRYFKMTTELYDNYNVIKAFSQGGVFPGGEYTKAKILDALKVWGDHSTIRCKDGKLVEVRFHLLGKYGNKFIPDSNHRGNGNCPNNIIFSAKTGTIRNQSGTPTKNNQPQITSVGSQNNAAATSEQKKAFLAGNQNQSQTSTPNQGQTAINSNQGQTASKKKQGQATNNQASTRANLSQAAGLANARSGPGNGLPQANTVSSQNNRSVPNNSNQPQRSSTSRGKKA